MRIVNGNRVIVIIIPVCLFIIISAVSLSAYDNMVNSQRQNVKVMRNYTSMPMAFTENQGQWDESVFFRADAGRATMWFTCEGAYYQFTRRIENKHVEDVLNPLDYDPAFNEPDSVETMMIKASLVGANPNPIISGEDMMGYKCNYFIGNNPDNWRSDVPNYEAIIFQGIYPGIDLKYYGTGQQMEYDFIVSPGADPSQICVRYDGGNSVLVNDNGELEVATDWGTVIEHKPRVYQILDDEFIPLDGAYTLRDNNTFGFEFENGYNTEYALVIDPVMSYSTYLGGSGNDFGFSISVDDSSNSYITGNTEATDFPTENPCQIDTGGTDVFVTKFSSYGDVVYSTYVGGNGDDFGDGIDADNSGNAYITGDTESPDFPTTDSAYQIDQGGRDAFVTKLNSSGNDLVFSTYLGGNNNNDWGHDIYVDGSGYAYVAGHTSSNDLSTPGACQSFQGDFDAFVAKLNSTGSDVFYITCLGGDDDDRGYGISVDNSGNAYVTGYTSSINFPTKDSIQSDQGGDDIFVTKLNSTGDNIIYSTYLGGSNLDVGSSISIDGLDNAYITGYTESPDFPIEGAYQTDQDTIDAFVTKINSFGNDLVYSTYLGGSNADHGAGISVDDLGNAYISGRTYSSDFPTKSGCQTFQGGYDAFVTKLNSSGNDIVYSTYLAGSDNEASSDISVDDSGYIYIVGYTNSSDFMTTDGAYQINQGAPAVWDAFMTKIYLGPSIDSLFPSQNALNVPANTNISVTFDTDMNPATINDTTFICYANMTGYHSGTISYDAPSRTATFDPNDDLAVGEVVTVTLTGNIKSDQDITLSVAYAWQFTVEALGGTGHYVLDSIYQIGGELNQALAADFDGDDYLDIIVMTTHDTGMYIMHNLGNGDFAAPNFIRFGEYDTTTYGVCVADYNSDGYLDVATSKQTEDSIMIIYNDGTGNFNSYDYYAVIPDPQYSSSADINGDGYFDIITPSHTTDSISVMINDGLGTFLPYSSYPVNGEGPLAVAVCDYDNDYDMDIATVEHAGDTGTVLLNNGDGTFIIGFGLSTGLLPVGIVGADLNNNGFIDLAIANGTSDSVYILLNDGGENFTVNSIYGVGNRPNYIISGDLNCDGFMDLSTIDLFSRNLSILLNCGDGTFAPNITFSTDTLSPQPHFAADLDNDGDLDIVLAASGNICIFMNQGEIQVTNTDDLGPGSLRWAIDSANTDPQPNDIVFAVSGTIEFDSELPAFTDDNTRIIGSTAPGGEYSVVFDGSSKAVSGSGLTIQSSNNYIEGLTITGFSDNGIEVAGVSSTGNTLTNNLIYGNGLLGINLGDDGVTTNDPGDSDDGPNDLLNYPEIDSVLMNPDSSFNVYGTAADSAIIEFFVAHPAGNSSIPADTSGHGEAYSYIGSDTCDENGDFQYKIANTISQLSIITATATDTFGNTSEFCENFVLIPGPLIIVGYSYAGSKSGCPSNINLRVIDPNGNSIGYDTANIFYDEIPNADYTETTECNDSVYITNPLLGTYTVEVVGEPDALPSTYYSVGVRLDGTDEVVEVVDQSTPPQDSTDSYVYEVEENWHYINGDANRDKTLNIFDITFIISYLYLNGTAPWPEHAADVNCDLVVNIFDITGLISYLYLDGEAPCDSNSL